MYTLDDIHQAGKDLEALYCLRTAPLAVKLVNRDEVPAGCRQPSADGKHYALCQAISFVRRTRNHLVLFKEDHWCLWPVINFRQGPISAEEERSLGSHYFIRDPEISYNHFHKEYPYIDADKQKDGMALAPLESCQFIPDAVMIYCEPSQLRQLLMSAKWHTGNITGASFDTCDSCGAALLPVLNGQVPYNVAIPDAGEYERALCGDNELTFTLSYETLPELVQSAKELRDNGFGLKQLSYDLKSDYARPKFYNDMFEAWGLETGEEWIPGQR